MTLRVMPRCVDADGGKAGSDDKLRASLRNLSSLNHVDCRQYHCISITATASITTAGAVAAAAAAAGWKAVSGWVGGKYATRTQR